MVQIEVCLDGRSSKDSRKTGAFVELPRAMCSKSDIFMQVMSSNTRTRNVFFKFFMSDTIMIAKSDSDRN